MAEIVGAIIGALLGGFFMWLLNRRQPTFIVCEEVSRYRIHLPLPETRVLYRDIPLQSLYVLQLKTFNIGSKVIEKPEFVIRLESEEAEIIEATTTIFPERGISDSPCRTLIKDSEVHVSLDRIYPHSLNRETALIEIFSNAPVSVSSVLGSGILSDGSGWSVQYKPYEEVKILGAYGPKRELPFLVFTVVNFFGLLSATIVYLIWHPPVGIISIDISAAQTWLSDRLLWILIGWIVMFVAWAFAMGLRGWSLPIPIPFLGRVIIYIERTRRKD